MSGDWSESVPKQDWQQVERDPVDLLVVEASRGHGRADHRHVLAIRGLVPFSLISASAADSTHAFALDPADLVSGACASSAPASWAFVLVPTDVVRRRLNTMRRVTRPATDTTATT